MMFCFLLIIVFFIALGLFLEYLAWMVSLRTLFFFFFEILDGLATERLGEFGCQLAWWEGM